MFETTLLYVCVSGDVGGKVPVCPSFSVSPKIQRVRASLLYRVGCPKVVEGIRGLEWGPM